jgi:predicted transcriptional regulator
LWEFDWVIFAFSQPFLYHYYNFNIIISIMLTTFLSHFNTIDKQLDDIVASDKFLPYNEKINTIAHGHYALTPRLRHHSDQLKYFGELRNLLIHHQGGNRHYIEITQEALDDITSLSQWITKPPSVREYMSSPVITCGLDNHVRDILKTHQTHYGHIPVMDGGVLVGGLSNDLLLQRIGKQGMIPMDELLVRNIPLVKPHHYHLISPEMSIVDAIHLFAERGDYHALLIDNKNDIQGIITRHDIPKIVEYIV